jgi:hypothetical protein
MHSHHSHTHTIYGYTHLHALAIVHPNQKPASRTPSLTIPFIHTCLPIYTCSVYLQLIHTPACAAVAAVQYARVMAWVT